MRTGYSRPLSEEDIYTHRDQDDARLLGDAMHTEWERECSESQAGDRKPKLYKAVVRCFKDYIITAGLIAFIQELFIRTVQPLLLVELIRYFGRAEGYTDVDGWLFASGIGFLALAYVCTHHGYTWHTSTCGMKMRIGCSTLIYRKVLQLSAASVNKMPVGQLVNMLSNDVNRFDLCCEFANYMWIAPIQALVVLIILGSELGPSCLAGFMAMFLLIPVQSVMGKAFSRLRHATAMCTDRRIRSTHAVISAMRAIKMFTWEKLFMGILEAARKSEMAVIRRKALLMSFNSSLFGTLTKMVVFLILLTYVMLGNPLMADKVFLTIALISSVQNSVTVYFPMSIINAAEVYMTCARLQKILEMEEKDEVGRIQHMETQLSPKEGGLMLYEVTCKWIKGAGENTLSSVSCSLKAGDLLAVIGPVGAGKSSLLNAILGELPVHAGRIFIQGRVSYSAQEPWLFSGNIRENVVFCQPFNEKKYWKVVRVCALEQDLEELPQGDLTQVGEHGTALSGGQKARVNLARAIYCDADVYLLDDPLSAVDPHVGRHIYDLCVTRHLRHKVTVLVTHQVQFLKEASKILVLNQGRIQAFGTYQHLMSSGVDLGSQVQGKENANPSSDDDIVKGQQGKDYIEESRRKSVPLAKKKKKKSTISLTNGVTHKLSKEESVPLKEGDRGGVEEVQWSGVVKLSTYYRYFQAGLGWPFLILFPLGNIIVQMLSLGTDYWLSYWTKYEQLLAEAQINGMLGNGTNSSLADDSTFDEYLDETTNVYIYTGLVLALFVGVFLRSFVFFFACTVSSTGLHANMLGAVIRAPLSYFEFRPVGQILNRFSKDLGQVDEQLPNQLLDSMNILLNVVGLLALVSTTNLWLLVPAVATFTAFILIRHFFLPTMCNVKRLEGVARSPVFTHLSVSLEGLATVRAFQSQGICTDQFIKFQNLHTTTWFTFLALKKGLIFCLDLVSSMYVILVTFSFMGSKDTLGGDLGLAISSAMTLSGVVFWGFYQSTEVENQLTSVERLLEYCDLDPEAPWVIPDKTPKPEWPELGVISFEDVCVQYSAQQPPVLKHLTFCIKGGEKIGIVGRTGAGKSSLVSSLFRLTEPAGDIRIDGLSLKELGLHDLRSRLCIIPQDPVLFPASVRSNVDPYSQATDAQLWDVLEEVQLKSVVQAMEGSLSAELAEGGHNLSVGQRQLLCLARAILRHKRVLILDEASANIDLRTDELIQEIIRTKFRQCTVLTIAHRLHTIMDCDRVMVLQHGHLKEFDEPHNLLQDKNSIFLSMAQQTGHNTCRRLQQIAEYAYLQKRNSLGKL